MSNIAKVMNFLSTDNEYLRMRLDLPKKSVPEKKPKKGLILISFLKK